MINYGLWIGSSLALAVVLTPATFPGWDSSEEPRTQTESPSKEIEDEEIVRAIEDELVTARGVSANNIDISCVRGVVRLQGTVEHLLAGERAVRISEMTKGVRSVVNELTVRESDRADTDIHQDIIEALAADPATDSYEVTVGVEDGTVTLDGNVDSYAEKNLTTRLVQGVRGVRGIDNKLIVSYHTERPNIEIRNDVEQRLAWDVRVDSTLVDVEVANGKVTLSGTVGSAAEKSMAEILSWVYGVHEVDVEGLGVAWWAKNDMRRVNSPSPDDEAIKNAVTAAFLFDPRVKSFNPKVTVKNGTVTLEGIVDNAKAKNAAAQDAMNTIGVWRVKNLLKVRSEVETTDEQLRTRIIDALERDPFVNRYKIRVFVDQGRARIHGVVDSRFEKAHAEDVVARCDGVTEIENSLKVDYTISTLPYTFYYDWDPALYDFDFDYETVHTKDDAEIYEDIRDEFWWSTYVDSDDIDVIVNDGVATLTGTVDTWSERRAATENAIEGGAYKVINKIVVRASSSD